MIKQFTIIALFALGTQSGIAGECNGDIPGHYSNRFVDNNDGTVRDNLTALTWMRCSLDQQWNNTSQSCDFSFNPQAQVVRNPLNWQETLLAVQDFNINVQLGNHTDWRLPDIKELASLVDLGCIDRSDPADDIAIDDNTFIFPSANYWSSTPVRIKAGKGLDNTSEDNIAWRFGFKLSSEFGAQSGKIGTPYFARLVRN